MDCRAAYHGIDIVGITPQVTAALGGKNQRGGDVGTPTTHNAISGLPVPVLCHEEDEDDTGTPIAVGVQDGRRRKRL